MASLFFSRCARIHQLCVTRDRHGAARSGLLARPAPHPVAPLPPTFYPRSRPAALRLDPRAGKLTFITNYSNSCFLAWSYCDMWLRVVLHVSMPTLVRIHLVCRCVHCRRWASTTCTASSTARGSTGTSTGCITRYGIQSLQCRKACQDYLLYQSTETSTRPF